MASRQQKWMDELRNDPEKWALFRQKQNEAAARFREKNPKAKKEKVKIVKVKTPKVVLTEEEKKARAKAAQEAWRRKQGITPRVKKVREKVVNVARVLKTEAEKREKARASRKRWRDANPKKVREHVREWTRKNAEKAKAYRDAWKAANPDKVKEHKKAFRERMRALKPVRVLLTDEQKREKRRVDMMVYRARKSRTPEGLMKVLNGLKWPKVQDPWGGWLTASWVPQALCVFPLQECCDWLERNGYGVKAVGGTMLEFRFDKRFDIAGDSPCAILGHKRIRNLDGILDWLEMVGCYFPQEWIELDFEPDRYEWADCLRNVLGHDLTKIKTAKGAKNKRFPVTMNLAAIESFIESHNMEGELYRRYMVKEGRAYIGIQLRDRTLWKKAIRDDGTLEDGAFVEAVDALKALPNMQWDVPDNDGVSEFIDGLNE